VGDRVFEDRPAGGIMAMLHARQADAAALQHPPDDSGGANRIVRPWLDLDQNAQAAVDEGAIDECPRVRNRPQPGLDRDSTGDQQAAELVGSIL
jgi:hypothetical protein